MRSDSRGFTLIEVLAATAIVGVILLAVGTMVITGYHTVDGGGKTTQAVGAGRQVIEEIRTLPFDTMINLNGFDTDNAGSLPTDDPERTLARRFRYRVAGTGTGWTFSGAELAAWATHVEDNYAMRAEVAVVAQTPTLNVVTVTITPQGRQPVELSTMIARP